MVVLFSLIDESVQLGDKLLVFSQSLLTLNLIEEFLARREVPGTDEKWTKNKNYFREFSTSGFIFCTGILLYSFQAAC